MGGIALGFGQAFNNTTVANIGQATRLLLPTDGMWKGAVWNLETESFLNTIRFAGRATAGSPFIALDPQPSWYLAFVGCWLIGLLALSILSFNRRDL
jgi:hypothetical protein